MNRIYEIGEGRPFWKLRPVMLVVTVVAVVLVALVAAMLVVAARSPRPSATPSVSGTRGDVWQIAKWPLLIGIVVSWSRSCTGPPRT